MLFTYHTISILTMTWSSFYLSPLHQATGAQMQTSINSLSRNILGECEQFEEKGLGDERYNMFTGCPAATTATIILRGE